MFTPEKKVGKGLLTFIAAIVPTGGLLFVFDTRVISGTQNFFTGHQQLGDY